MIGTAIETAIAKFPRGLGGPVTMDHGVEYVDGTFRVRTEQPSWEQYRNNIIHDFGFAILTAEAVQKLYHYGPIIEVGAGGGYWAYELKQAGVDIIPTDLYPPKGTSVHFDEHRRPIRVWMQPTEMEASVAAKRHPDRALMMVWPSIGEDWAAQAVRAYRGSTVIYCGEWRGCTGDQSLHDELQDNWEQVDQIDIPNWDGIHDAIFVFRRAPTL